MKIELINKRISGFIDYESADRRSLKGVLEILRSQLPDAFVFGGMLRDIGMGGARGFSSDIDLVSTASAEDIASVINQFGPTRNKFGGFRFVVDKWRFDIWSFRETWAFREGLVQSNLVFDILKTTFFNVDAAIFDIGQRRLICSSAYIEGLSERVLEINLEGNPSPHAMIRRALKLVDAGGFSIGPRLGAFMLSQQAASLVSAWLRSELELHFSRNGRLPFNYSPQLKIKDR